MYNIQCKATKNDIEVIPKEQVFPLSPPLNRASFSELFVLQKIFGLKKNICIAKFSRRKVVGSCAVCNVVWAQMTTRLDISFRFWKYEKNNL